MYDIVGVSATIKNDPTLSFYIKSTDYPDLFEIESCAICPSNGRLYFATNSRVTSEDANHDGVHYFSQYIYDPSSGITQPEHYRWVFGSLMRTVTDGGAAYNDLIIKSGSNKDGALSDMRAKLTKPVILKHDKPWIVEWKSTGSWSAGGLLFASYSMSKYTGNTYLYRRQGSGLIALGEYSGGKHHNYGVNLSNHGIDGSLTGSPIKLPLTAPIWSTSVWMGWSCVR